MNRKLTSSCAFLVLVLSDVLFGAALGYAIGKTVGDTDEEIPMLHAHLLPGYPGEVEHAMGFGLEWPLG